MATQADDKISETHSVASKISQVSYWTKPPEKLSEDVDHLPQKQFCKIGGKERIFVKTG